MLEEETSFVDYYTTLSLSDYITLNGRMSDELEKTDCDLIKVLP
jgi:hypothetical protein